MPLLLLGVGASDVQTADAQPTATGSTAAADALTPDGGFLLPLLPPTYLQEWSGAAAQVAPLDQQFAAAWAYLQAVLDAQDVRVALGNDLTALGRKYGIQRVAGEGDEQLRARIIGTLRSRTPACTLGGMADRLQQATGIPVSVTDDPATAGYFVVLIFGNPPQGTAVVDLVKKWKTPGTDFTLAIVAPAMGQIGRLGTFRLGTTGLGGGQSYTVLHAPPPVTGQPNRLPVRLGTVRL